MEVPPWLAAGRVVALRGGFPSPEEGGQHQCTPGGVCRGVFSREAAHHVEGVEAAPQSPVPPPWLVRPCSIRKQLFCAPLSPSLSLRRTLALGMETRQIFHIPLCPVMFKNVRDSFFLMLQAWLALKQ